VAEASLQRSFRLDNVSGHWGIMQSHIPRARGNDKPPNYVHHDISRPRNPASYVLQGTFDTLHIDNVQPIGNYPVGLTVIVVG
jgi:hypothetical protein